LSGYHLALLTNGTVLRWNIDGALSLSGSGSSNAVAVAADNYNDLELRPNGTLAGAALQGAPTRITTLSNAVSIAQGAQHSLVLTADGNVLAWGNNTYGQTNIPSGLTNIVAIDAGGYHNLALKGDGTVFAWGRNLEKQTNVPPGLGSVVAIAAGLYHNVALKSDGTVVAWGYNASGQTNVPFGLTNVVAIAADPNNSVALVGNGPPQTGAMLSNPKWTGSGFSLSLASASKRVYALEYKNALSDNAWVALPLVAGNGSAINLLDPGAGTNGQRFYRVRRW
jgi:alpha-tubulin suppressor-like RCC1 family protein